MAVTAAGPRLREGGAQGDRECRRTRNICATCASPRNHS